VEAVFGFRGVARAELSRAAVEQAAALVGEAERPILLVGGECRTAEFRKDLITLSERWNILVAATNKMQDQFPNEAAARNGGAASR